VRRGRGLGDDELVGEFGDLTGVGGAHEGDVLADGLKRGEGAGVTDVAFVGGDGGGICGVAEANG
jgi:hypothetical protein